MPWDVLRKLIYEEDAFDNIVISPGPGSPMCTKDIGKFFSLFYIWLSIAVWKCIFSPFGIYKKIFGRCMLADPERVCRYSCIGSVLRTPGTWPQYFNNAAWAALANLYWLYEIVDLCIREYLVSSISGALDFSSYTYNAQYLLMHMPLFYQQIMAHKIQHIFKDPENIYAGTRICPWCKSCTCSGA